MNERDVFVIIRAIPILLCLVAGFKWFRGSLIVDLLFPDDQEPVLDEPLIIGFYLMTVIMGMVIIVNAVHYCFHPLPAPPPPPHRRRRRLLRHHHHRLGGA